MHYFQLTVVNPRVALRVKQDTIAHIMASTEDPPDDLMAAPSGHPGNLVAAFRTESVLSEPKADELLPAFGTPVHLQVKPTLKVRFPKRVVGISIPLDFDVSDDRDRRAVKSLVRIGFPSLPRDPSRKTSRLPSRGSKYFLKTHLEGLLRCLLRAQRHKQSKMAESTLENVALLATYR